MQARAATSTHPVRRFGPDTQTDAKGTALGMGEADTDPFLMMAEDRFGPDKGFDWHPHRGIETVTLILDGSSPTPTTPEAPACSAPATSSG